jgi:hypothetical protein
MGPDVGQDWAIPLPAMHALMDSLEMNWSKALTAPEKEMIGMLGTYTVIAFYVSFQGNEVFLVDLYGTRKYLSADNWQKDVVIIPFLGRFKGRLESDTI